MQYFRETVGCEVVSIDDESFLADGVRFSLRDILDVKGVYCATEGNAAQSLVDGAGAVVSGLSGCVLGPILGGCIFLGGIALLIGLFANGASVTMVIPFIACGIFVMFLAKGIGVAHYNAVEAMELKVYHLRILTCFGERNVLIGKSCDFLQRVSQILSVAVLARRTNDEIIRRNANTWLENLANLPNYIVKAENGDVEAQCIVARMYLNGEGLTKDPVKAVRFLQMASDHGHADAQRKLGELFAEGANGVSQNYDMASAQLAKASQNPNATNEQRNEAIEKLEEVAEARTKELEANKKNKRRFLILLASSVLFIPLLMVLSTIISGKDPLKIERMQREQVEREQAEKMKEIAKDACIRIGTWEAIAEDKHNKEKSEAILIITESGKNGCSGYLKWKGYKDALELRGEIDPKTKELVLRGSNILNKTRKGMQFSANVSDKTLSGTVYWGYESGVTAGTWKAVWTTEKVEWERMQEKTQ